MGSRGKRGCVGARSAKDRPSGRRWHPRRAAGYDPAPMTTHTFAAVLGVKDEVELIGACVDRLRRIGVERIRVLDAGSTDGTLDVLASLAGPDLSVTHHS